MTQDIHGGNPEAIANRLGLQKLPPIQYDFSVNLNPAGPPPLVEEYFQNGFNWTDYPESSPTSACTALAAAHNLPENRIMVGNGATEIFALLLQVIKPAKAARLVPSYSGYSEVCEKAVIDCQAVTVLLNLPEVVFIGHPNNPTGQLQKREALIKSIRKNRQTTFIIDESFMDFVTHAEDHSLIHEEEPNLVIVKSLTKMFCIAGIRLGMVVGPEATINKLKQAQLPWSVNAAAQGVAPLLYQDLTHLKKSREKTVKLRFYMSEQLSKIAGITVHPSETNFILVEFEEEIADQLQGELLKSGIFIRSCSCFEGLGNRFVRLAVKDREMTDILCAALGMLGSNNPASNCP